MFGMLFQFQEDTLHISTLRFPDNVCHHRLAFRYGSRLVEYNRIYFFCHFQTFGILDQYTTFGPFADTHHNSRRSSQSQGTRAGDNQYSNGCQQSMCKAVLRQHNPRNESQHGNRHDGRNEYGCNFVDQLLYGCLASLSFLYQMNNVRKHCVSSHFFRPKAKTSFLVDGSGIYFSSGSFLNRDRFTAQHTLVYEGTARGYGTIYGDTFARFYDNHVAGNNLFNAHFPFAGSVVEDNRMRL